MHRVVEERHRLRLSQRKFSELLGIPTRTIEDWEVGRRTPPEYVVRLLLFYLENSDDIKKIREQYTYEHF